MSLCTQMLYHMILVRVWVIILNFILMCYLFYFIFFLSSFPGLHIVIAVVIECLLSTSFFKEFLNNFINTKFMISIQSLITEWRNRVLDGYSPSPHQTKKEKRYFLSSYLPFKTFSEKSFFFFFFFLFSCRCGWGGGEW